MAKFNALVQAFTKMAPHYEAVVDRELNTFWGWGYDSFVNRLLEMTPIGDNDLILDVATGTAAIPLKLTDGNLHHRQVVGLDLTFAMLATARQRVIMGDSPIALTCASATCMPFRSACFDVITCGLASHHIEVNQLLFEMRRVLKTGGALTIADVSVPPVVRKPPVSFLLSVATFLYFLWNHGYSRGRAEAEAIQNVRTVAEWRDLLIEQGFGDLTIERPPSRYRWIPAPVFINARAIQLR